MATAAQTAADIELVRNCLSRALDCIPGVCVQWEGAIPSPPPPCGIIVVKNIEQGGVGARYDVVYELHCYLCNGTEESRDAQMVFIRTALSDLFATVCPTLFGVVTDADLVDIDPATVTEGTPDGQGLCSDYNVQVLTVQFSEL